MLDSFLLMSLALGNVNRLSLYISPADNQIPASHNSRKKIISEDTSQNYPASKMIVTQPLSLQIWQDDPRLIPPGDRSMAKRPIGFAQLNWTFENKSQQPILLKLQTIEVRSIGSKQALMSIPGRDLTLNPLEISPQRYQLSNLEGYGNLERVEAVVIYELDGRNYTLRSSPVNVSKPSP